MVNYTDDYDIIKETLYEDKEHFNKLIDRYKNSIFNFVYRMTGNHHDADDITMDTFIQAYKKLGEFKFGFKFKTWLYTIAANITRDRLRRKKILKILPLAAFRDKDDYNNFDMDVPDTSAGPEKLLDNSEAINNVRKIINTLPLKYREVFLLRYLDNLSYDEISSVLGLPAGTVENRLFRAKKLLMKEKELLKKLL